MTGLVFQDYTTTHETLDRFSRDASFYNGILLDRAGADGVLFGNLKVNGS